MDDFEEDELYDDYYDQYDDDGGDGESLKDKYDKAKEYKEKFDEYKEKYNNHKNKSANKPSNGVAKDAGKDAAKKGGKEAAKQGSKEVSKQAGKQVAKETGKQVAKETGKQVAKQGAKVAAQGAASATGVGVAVAAAIEVADRLNKIKKKIDKKTDAAIEEATGIKNFSKKKKFIPILLIFGIFMLIFIVPAMAMYSVSEVATSELTTLVRTREEVNKKKLIFFTKSELKNLLNKDINDVEEEIVKKLADEGYTLENENGKYKSSSYKNILKGYGDDLTTVFTPNDLTGAANGMEDVLEDGTTYDSLSEEDKENAVSLKNVKKYLMAEIDNFNEGVTWNKANLDVEYLNIKGENFSTYSDYLNNSQKVVANGTGSLVNSEITNKNYTVKDENGKDTMLKMPKLSDYGVNVGTYGGESSAARNVVSMLEPYMQKWVIPYTMYMDTQDDDFVNSVMKYMYHPADVSIFQLQKLVKTTQFEYYMVCQKYTVAKTCNDETGRCSAKKKVAGTTSTRDPQTGKKYNSSYCTIGSVPAGSRVSGKSTTYYEEVTEVAYPYEIAKDTDGNPLVRSIKIKREKKSADSIPSIVHVEGFYDIVNREYNIIPLNENSTADSTTPSELYVNTRTGIGSDSLVEVWNESLRMVNSDTKKYQVSYYTEEQMEDLGREISRIEWYQDSNSVGSSGAEGAAGGGINQTQQDYIDRFKEDALNDMNESGVLASITLAQGILEGGSGTSSLAATYNNHFGIKAGSSWTGDTVVLKTGEYDKSGNYYNINAAFRAYDSAADSFADHSKFIWNTRGHSTKPGGYRYRDCTEYAKSMTYTAPDGAPTYNYKKAIEAIVNGGYCTDPAYVGKICNIIEKYKLYEIDRQSTWDGSAPAYATVNTSGGTGTSSSISVGGGETLYSYDDMAFAYYQIEQWYAKSKFVLTANTIKRVALPEGGFSWPVQTSGNDDAKKILKLYGAENNDGLIISTGNVYNYDSDEGIYKGANVIATHSGSVKKVVPVSDASTYAYVEIATDDGKYKTHYGNLSEINVSEGDTISKGQTIGKIGNTGSSATGSDIYLTYKMYYNGSKVDPLQYYYIKDIDLGKRVDNYNDIDKAAANPGQYVYDGSRQYSAGSSEAIEGDINQGIEYYFISSSGKTFNCYLQNKGPWASSQYGDLTIGAQGCSIVAVATVLTGYGYEVTPETFSGGIQGIFALTKRYIDTSHFYNYDGTRIDRAQSTRDGYATAKSKADIINHLAIGKEVIIHVGASSKYSGETHWMAVLDIREASGGYEVFVADPYSGYQPRGWRKLEDMLVGLSDYILVDEDGV